MRIPGRIPGAWSRKRVGSGPVRQPVPLDELRLARLGDQVDHGLLDAATRGLVREQRFAGVRRHRDRPSRVEAVEHARVDVRGTGHRRRVAEEEGHSLDGVVDAALTRRLGLRHLAGHGDSGKHGAVPGAEVLRGELPFGRTLDVVVHVRGGHVDPAPALAIGEQLGTAPAPLLERRHDRHELCVGDRLLLALIALAGIVELDLGAVQSHVLLQQGREPVALVLLGIVLGPDAEHAEVEQAHAAREHLVPAQLAGGEVALHDSPQGAGAPRRTRASRRTSAGRAACASRRGTGTAYARRHRRRSPAGDRAAACRSTRPSTRAESPAHGCVRASPRRRCDPRRRRGTRTRGHAACA